MLLSELNNKSILILGFGTEGRDTFLFLRKKFPKLSLGIADRKPKLQVRNKGNTKLHLGKNYLKAIGKYQVIIKSPGIPTKALKRFLKPGQILTSQAALFFANCPGTIVGVTGTKGKSTTSSLIYAALKEG